jgi:hypothetical protein
MTMSFRMTAAAAALKGFPRAFRVAPKAFIDGFVRAAA